MYNSMSRLPSIPYKIVEHLALNDEVIWKMLASNDYEALNRPDLTFSEKLKYLWKTGKQEQYSIFLTNLVEDAIPTSKSIMKIYQYHTHASDLYTGAVVYAFDFLYGGQMSLVDYNGYPASRGDIFINRILDTLNGVDVDGVGKMVFLDQMSNYNLAHSVVGNSKTFTGVQIFLSTLVGDGGTEDGCTV